MCLCKDAKVCFEIIFILTKLITKIMFAFKVRYSTHLPQLTPLVCMSDSTNHKSDLKSSQRFSVYILWEVILLMYYVYLSLHIRLGQEKLLSQLHSMAKGFKKPLIFGVLVYFNSFRVIFCRDLVQQIVLRCQDTLIFSLVITYWSCMAESGHFKSFKCLYMVTCT